MTSPIQAPSSDQDQRWIRINRTALANNLAAIRRKIGTAELMAVVKANAYGHGAAETARIFQKEGADWFGVTTLNEALQLLKIGIDSRQTPILLFAPLVNSEQVSAALDYSLHLTVCDQDHLKLVQDVEKTSGTAASLHLKVDTGMGRLGLSETAALEVVQSRPTWAGIYTHCARASEKDLSFTQRQLEIFSRFCATCKSAGVDTGLCHCANTAVALRVPELRGDMVRIGTALYGQMPSQYVPRPDGLSADTFQPQAQVVFIHSLKSGETVGYGAEFTAKRAMKVAVIPIGFADGFGVAPTSLYRGWRGITQIIADRAQKRSPYVAIGGQRCSVIGRVAMQMIVVDITDHTGEVAVGDIADIPMRRLSASASLPRRYEAW